MTPILVRRATEDDAAAIARIGGPGMRLDGARCYSERMGVHFPPDTRPLRLILMRSAGS